MSALGPITPAEGRGPNASGIENALEAFLISSPKRLTAADLERQVAVQEGCSRTLVRSGIRNLIERGVFEYSYTFGQSYLVLSFRYPVDVTSCLTIVPPYFAGRLASPRRAISIAPGVAFGSGRHPTTRLSLQAVEKGWQDLQAHGLDTRAAVIDIGTGSGILAIAATKLGAERALALDIDACARSEARKNVNLNSDVDVVVSGAPIETVDDSFHMIIANLRLPTLICYAGWMRAHLVQGGRMVISGFRQNETERLTRRYTREGLIPVWEKTETGWSVIIFREG